MSKLNYSFLPIPRYFSDIDCFKNHKMCAFIIWCFSRCSAERREVYHDHKIVVLEPFEFIFGRRICAEETGLTEQEIRTLINQLKTTQIGEILKKSTSKTTSKFTVYKWSTELFSEKRNQQNNQQPTSNQPASNHNLDTKNLVIQEATTPTPSKENSVGVVFYDCLINEKIDEKEKRGLSKFPEENVIHAIKFADSLNGKYNKSRVHTLFWAVKNLPTLPTPFITQQQEIAFEFNEWGKEHFGEKIYNENFENIKNNKLRAWDGDIYVISLKNDIKTVKLDVQQFKNELTNTKRVTCSGL